MDQPSNQSWFLRKHEGGTVFGPVSFEQLAQWASTAQIAPHDAVSIDQLTWTKAPMLPELAMDWLVELTSEQYYGPTTLGAIQEFLRLGEIDAETFVINSCDGTRRQIHELSALLTAPGPAPSAAVSMEDTAFSDAPGASGISIDLHDRIRDLEQTLQEERRALEESEERCRELERKYRELLEQKGG